MGFEMDVVVRTSRRPEHPAAACPIKRSPNPDRTWGCASLGDKLSLVGELNRRRADSTRNEWDDALGCLQPASSRLTRWVDRSDRLV
jgi:hypothetical protein